MTTGTRWTWVWMLMLVAGVAWSNPSGEVGEKFLYFKASPFSGGLYQNGQRVNLGFFGSRIDEVFGEYPDALAAAQASRNLGIAGSVVLGVGLTVLLVEMVLVIAMADDLNENGVPAWYWAGLGIGGVTGIVGAVLVGLAGSKGIEAVNRYNFHLMNRILPPEQRLDPNKLLSRRPAVSVLQLTF
jgi:hypothetical protein